MFSICLADKNKYICQHVSSSVCRIHACGDDIHLRQVNGGPSVCLANRDSPASDITSIMDTITNMKLNNPLKELVSKRRKRYTADGFNLDLTCILFHIALRNSDADATFKKTIISPNKTISNHHELFIEHLSTNLITLNMK